MILRAATVWIVGLLTAVPYATYYLLYQAHRDQYAWLITFVLFWIFGYWGVVGPLIAAIRVRRVFASLEAATTREEIEKALRSEDARDAAIDLIASDNHIPRFLAARVYRLLVDKVLPAAGSRHAASTRAIRSGVSEHDRSGDPARRRLGRDRET